MHQTCHRYFFVAFDLLAIASIGIALQNKCFRLFLKNLGYISPPRFFKNNLKHLFCRAMPIEAIARRSKATKICMSGAYKCG